MSIEGEVLWAGMSGSVEAPRFDLNVDTISGRYRRASRSCRRSTSTPVFAGSRSTSTASIFNFERVNWKPGIWEPVIGTTFRPQLTKKLRLFTQAGMGFSTHDSSRSGSVTANVRMETD